MHRSIKVIAASLAIMGLSLGSLSSALAGPNPYHKNKCYVVKNVASWDVLNIRKRPHYRAPIVGVLKPFYKHGIIARSGPCVPYWRFWKQRWCKITHYDGYNITRGWVKRKFLRRHQCPG